MYETGGGTSGFTKFVLISALVVALTFTVWEAVKVFASIGIWPSLAIIFGLMAKAFGSPFTAFMLFAGIVLVLTLGYLFFTMDRMVRLFSFTKIFARKDSEYFRGHPGRRPSFRIAKDMQSDRLYLEMKKNSHRWKVVLVGNSGNYTTDTKNGSTKYFKDFEEARLFIDKNLDVYQKQLNEWEIKHRKNKAVRGSRIYK